jgi:hypothetical protein
MTFTPHFNTRKEQRGISSIMIETAIEIGTAIQKQGLDMIVVLDKDIPPNMNKQVAKRLIGLIILISDGVGITTYKGGRNAYKHLKKKGKKNLKK